MVRDGWMTRARGVVPVVGGEPADLGAADRAAPAASRAVHVHMNVREGICRHRRERDVCPRVVPYAGRGVDVGDLGCGERVAAMRRGVHEVVDRGDPRQVIGRGGDPLPVGLVAVDVRPVVLDAVGDQGVVRLDCHGAHLAVADEGRGAAPSTSSAPSAAARHRSSESATSPAIDTALPSEATASPFPEPDHSLLGSVWPTPHYTPADGGQSNRFCLWKLPLPNRSSHFS